MQPGERVAVGDERRVAEVALEHVQGAGCIAAIGKQLLELGRTQMGDAHLGDLVGRAVHEHRPVVDEHDGVGEVLEVARDMARDEDRTPVALHPLAQHVEHLLAHDGVEAGGGLVQDEQVRAACEHACELDLHAHAARELLDGLVERVERELGAHLVETATFEAGVGELVGARHLPRRHELWECGDRAHVAHARLERDELLLGQLRGVLAEQLDRSALEVDRTQDGRRSGR